MKYKWISLAIGLLLIGASFGGSLPVKADTAPGITLTPASGPVGTAIAITGSGFAATTSGNIWFDANGNGKEDSGEPSRMISTTSSGAIPNFTRLTAPKTASGIYKILVDVPAGDNTEASADFSVTPSITLSQVTGYSGTDVTIAGTGFAANAVGHVWFDTNSDGKRQDNETQVSVTCDGNGSIPDGTTLATPPTGPGVYRIEADLPDGGAVEASAVFTYTPTLVLSPSPVTSNLGAVIMYTVITIDVSGGGFAPGAAGFIWFDYNNNGIRDTGESQMSVTATADGMIPSGVVLTTPKLACNTAYNVLADIPGGGDIEATGILKVAETTTSVIITKHDPYGNVISTTTVSWDWMKANLPVVGDGKTDYYIQKGTAVSDTLDDAWDPQETNTDSLLEMGAIQGTDVKDLLNLVGGASAGDTVLFTASDGWTTWFDSANINNPDPRQGKVVLAWWNSLSGGYMPEFYLGMRLFCLAETTNAAGQHIYGDWDMHETLAPAFWQFSPIGAATSRLSEKYVSNIDIYEPNLFACDASGNTVSNYTEGQTVYVKGEGLTPNTSYKLWIQPDGVTLSPLGALDLPTGTYTLSSANDPSGSQESVTTDSKGDFPPTAIWALGASDAAASKWDIVADNQSAGTVGTYESQDSLANEGGESFRAYATVNSKLFSTRNMFWFGGSLLVLLAGVSVVIAVQRKSRKFNPDNLSE